MHKALLAVVCLVFLPISAVHAEFFSWTDKNGINHATDDISKVPEEYRAQAQTNKVADEEQAPGTGTGQAPSAPAAREKKAMKRQPSVAEHTDINGNGEAYWQERAEELRNRIAELEEEYEYARQEEQACEKNHRVDYRGRGVDCAGIYGPQKKRIQQSIERTRKALEVDLPEEARKLGAYPGWIR